MKLLFIGLNLHLSVLKSTLLYIHLSIHTSTINFQDKGIMKSAILLYCQVKYHVTTKPARSVLEHVSSTGQHITIVAMVTFQALAVTFGHF